MPDKIIHLTAQTDGERLDKLLAALIPKLSRTEAQRLIDAGRVQTTGQSLKASTLIPAGTGLTVSIPLTEPTVLEAEPLPLTILYEDDQLVVIDKPAGMVVHPGAGHHQGTLVNGLLHRYPALRTLDPERPGIVHRLDKETSGVIVIALNKAALKNLRAQFKDRQVHKMYLALVHGCPSPPEGIIDVPISRHPQHRQRMTALVGGKPARTVYRLSNRFARYALLELEPETGRTHQIRVHLAWLGYPVVGDKVYGRRREPFSLQRHFLHAAQLSINHPLSGQRLSFETPLPSELQQIIEQLAFRGASRR